MTPGSRTPTWRERENNKRRERRRRAIAAKIYAGLRMHGNYRLQKHCDNNAVLKALCEEAGWTVEDDGTTYRKGCKPVECMDFIGPSTSPSPCSSYQPSPCTSHNPSPASSTLASPAFSTIITNAKKTSAIEGNSLVPWLNSLSSATSSTFTSSKLPSLHNLYVNGGSVSAPVTPPLSSPTARSPRIKTDWSYAGFQPAWPGFDFAFLPSSMPPSPGRQVNSDAAMLAGFQLPSGGPPSPTFSLVSSHPFGLCKEANGSRIWTTGKSGTCSPVPCEHSYGDVQTLDSCLDEFAFGNSCNNAPEETGIVKPWEGERIHEVCVSDELELTLGSTITKSVA